MMAKTKARAVSATYRWSVFSRVVAASVGGYALTSLLSSLLALGLPHVSSFSRANAVLTATLFSFVIYTVIAIWVFHASSARRVWCVLIVLALASGGLLQVLRSAAA